MGKPKRTQSLIRRSPKGSVFPVQISYAGPDISIVLTVNVKPGTTIRQVFELSGIQKVAKNARLIEGQVGIFSEIRPLDTQVQENDRIEIYRPLAASPKETRKKRIEKASSTVSQEKEGGAA